MALAPARKPASLARRVATGGAWATVLKVFAALALLAVDALLARTLAPAELGMFFLAVSVVGIVATLAEFGFGRVTVRLVAERVARADGGGIRTLLGRVMTVALLIALATSVLYGLIGAPLLSELFDSPILAAGSWIIALWILATAAKRLLAEAHRGFSDIRTASILGYTAEGLGYALGMLALLAVIRSAGIAGIRPVLVAAATATCLTAIFGAIVLQRRMAPAGTPATTAPLSHRSLLAIALPVLATSIAAIAMTPQADIWILGAILDSEEVALYAAPARLVASVAASLAIVNSVVPPFIAELHSTGQRAKLQRVLQSTATIAGIPSLVVLAVMILAAGPVLGRLYGPYYSAAAPLLVVLAVGQVVKVVCGSCGVTLLMTGHERVVMWITALSAAVAIPIAVAAGMRYGVMGVAVVSSAKVMVNNLALVAATRRHAGVWTTASLSPALLKDGLAFLRRRKR